MRKKSTSKSSPRVVRSLHLPPAADRQITQAARLSGESVVAFIRAAAVSRAATVLSSENTPPQSAAA